MKGISTWLPLAGYVFVAVISVISASQAENKVIMWLLYTATVVSLTLAVTRFINTRKMNDRIKYLENHHLSVTTDEENEELIINEGI